MSKSYLYLATLLGLLLAHCGPDKLAGGAGAGNPPLAEVTLAFTASSLADTALPKVSGGGLAKASGIVLRNPDGSFTVRDSSGSDLTLTSIDVLVSRIDFNLPDSLDCEDAKGTVCDSGEVSIRGSFAMDLMTGASTPALSKIRLPAGLYKKVGLELKEEAVESGKSGMGKLGEDSFAPNMIIKGRTDGSKGPARLFALKLNLREGLDFEKPDGFTITAASLNNVQMQLAVDNWLQGVKLSSCLDTTTVLPDSSGTWNLEGDDFCAGDGLRIRRNIEASGDIDNHEGEEGH
ncbi:MAG: hypothetical protein JWO30_4848 [Fibrobacteres bacterium]|nr:hypothetical protein [Fibrobacterota bacterium]